MSAGPMQAPVPATEIPGLSPVARVANMFFAPTKTFNDLRRSANWLVPFVLIAICSVAFAYAVDTKIGYDKVAEAQVKLNAKAADQLDRLSPEQRAQRMDWSAKFSRYLGYGMFLPFLLGYIVVAAILMGTFNFGFGAEVRFSTSLAIVIFSSVPGILRELLGILTIFAGVDPDGFMVQNPVATNPASLVDVAAHPALYSFLAGFDVLKFWTLILTGIGFACLTKVKRGTSIGVIFAWYFIFILLSVGIAAAFS